MYGDTTIRAGEAIDTNIVAYAPTPGSPSIPVISQETSIYLWANQTQAQAGADATDIVVTRTVAGAGAATGTYPAAAHVRSPDVYGPTGVDFTGTEILPGVADVRLSIGYGEAGTEFTGTYAGGTGSAKRRGVRMF